MVQIVMEQLEQWPNPGYGPPKTKHAEWVLVRTWMQTTKTEGFLVDTIEIHICIENAT